MVKFIVYLGYFLESTVAKLLVRMSDYLFLYIAREFFFFLVYSVVVFIVSGIFC